MDISECWLLQRGGLYNFWGEISDSYVLCYNFFHTVDLQDVAVIRLVCVGMTSVEYFELFMLSFTINLWNEVG